MTHAPFEVVLRVDAGADDESAELALRLRDELRDADVVSVQLQRAGASPPGAKMGEAVEWGTLVVGLVSSGALTALLTTAGSWVTRQHTARIHIKVGEDELLLTGMPSDEQRRLIDEWLARTVRDA
jgi:Effector Associated Constant Component 1